METAWYSRLLIPWIGWFVFDLLLLVIIKPKRMTSAGGSKSLETVSYISLIAGWVLAWFIAYSINMAFWAGLSIIIFGLIISSLSFAAMREHPERKQTIVLWVYFVLYAALSHFWVLSEEKINVEKFGRECVDCMEKVPRYFLK